MGPPVGGLFQGAIAGAIHRDSGGFCRQAVNAGRCLEGLLFWSRLSQVPRGIEMSLQLTPLVEPGIAGVAEILPGLRRW